ncbi:MAG: hypothetical protein ABR524_13815 [Thermoanaerobaculia bacterium]
MKDPETWDEKSLRRLAGRIRSGREMLRNFPGMSKEMQDRLFHLVMDCEDCRYEAEQHALKKRAAKGEH